MNRTLLSGLALSLAALVTACTSTPPAGAEGSPKGASATATPPGEAAAKSPTGKPEGAEAPADPGPLLTYRSGEQKVTDHEAATVKVGSKLVSKGHVYLEAEVPANLPFPITTEERRIRIVVKGARHGVGAVERDRAGTTPRILVRLVGDAVPDRLELVWYDEGPTYNYRNEVACHRQPITLSGAAAAKEDSGLDSRFFLALAGAFDNLGRLSWNGSRPFPAFASGRARLLAGERGTDVAARPTRESKTDLSEMMSLYTGMLSVEEALQADRGLLVRAEQAEATIPIADVEGVALASHPWDEMIREMGKEPVIEPLASAVPADMLYVHFHDLRTAVKLMGDITEWVKPAAELLEGAAGTSHLAERYEESLMIERTGLAEKLGHLAASGVAFVASDPFFREGTDVSILFKVRNKGLLTTALAGYEANARAKHPDLAESKLDVGGHEVRVFATPDRTVNQHRVELGDVLVVSNSRGAVEKLVAVANGKAEPLAKSGDFRALRAMYPYGKDKDGEDGFVFLSDAFVGHVVSPAVKVLSARRMAAQADLFAAGYSALLYGWLEGSKAASVDAIGDAGLLRKEELTHTGGAPITLSLERGASSAAWGRPVALTPLADLHVDKVTPAERDAYDRFRTTYQSYWRTYIDPIAVRVRLSEDGKSVSLDARMLPLIERSDYDSMVRDVGQARVAPADLRSGIHWTLAVGADAHLREELDTIGKMLGRSDVGFGWLGGWVAIGAMDRSGLWDIGLVSREIPELPPEDGSSSKRRGDEWKVAARAPIYVAAHVKNPLGLAATLTAIRGAVTAAAPGLVEWGDGGTYREVPVVTIKAQPQANRYDEGLDQLAIHYATVEDVFVASLDRTTLQLSIDAVLGGRFPKQLAKDSKEGAQTILQVAVSKPDGWLQKTLLGLLEGQARQALRASLRDMEALDRGLGGLPPEGDARRDAAMAFLGYEPRSVQGGTFERGEDGAIKSSIYGSEARPIYPPIPIEDAPVTRLVQSLAHLGMGVAFEGEGKMRGLHVTFDWKRR